MANPRPDLVPESELKHIPVEALVLMRGAKDDYADAASVLGLGQGDLVDLRLPPFQRGLKWNLDRLSEFHDSVIQGWPIGVMVVAIESSKLLNKKSELRRFRLSLIDGQQRSWAFSQLLNDFWTRPWYAFESPKWDALGPAVGAIAEAGEALDTLISELGSNRADIEPAIAAIAADQGREVFEDYATLLEELCGGLGIDIDTVKKPGKQAARKLATALLEQETLLRKLPIPVLLLSEALKDQLPTIFRRLNEGVPLKGYDLLAATWGSDRLLGPKTSVQGRKFLADVLRVADDRIADTYKDPAGGYEFDPNLEPLELVDLSLFDLLYFLSKTIAPPPTFNISSDVLAFQVAATVFNGHVNKVDENLRAAFPVNAEGEPDIGDVPRLFKQAAENIELALKPMMDVTAKNLTSFKGRVGLTQAVVYMSTFLTHQNKVVAASKGARLCIAPRGNSADDRTVRAGLVLTAGQRSERLKQNLPAWFVHDALTSVFAGSRAYEAANDRVWKSFHVGTGRTRRRVLETSNTMFETPALDDLLDAFERLWVAELAVDHTPQRRRVSDGGAVLLRTAFSDLTVHDTDIDHVIPLGLGRSAAAAAGQIYPLNHVANQMPLEVSINASRKDTDWAVYQLQLSPKQRNMVRKCLLVPWVDTTLTQLASADVFVLFLAKRYRRLVDRALTNLQITEWETLSQTQRTTMLSRIAVGRP